MQSHGSYLMPSLEHATVGDAMHPGVLSCDPDAALPEIARMLAMHHVHCIAVMGVAQDGSGSESLAWGIISDADVLEAGIRPALGQSAAALARHAFISVDPTTPLLEAAELMLARRVTHLLVVDPHRQRPVGVLSTLDIAGVLAWGEG
jgi:CBS domain-containing protein